jgi:CubicO group peptidase (beta-lactamase class C family)
VVVLLGVSLAVSAMAGCSQPQLPVVSTAELVRPLRAKLTEPGDRGAVALVTADESQAAYDGADAASVFEIGSITKALTGLLLAEAVRRGEVGLDDELGRYLDLGASPAASVTLMQLATHHSGLPSHPPVVPGVEPFTETLDELLAEARELPVTPGQPYLFSDIGVALLGHALAAAAGTGYAELLEQRVLEPAGMSDATVPANFDELSDSYVGGLTGARHPAEPFVGEAWAPSLGVHATLGDLVALAQAVIDGPFSDSAALDPTGAVGNNRREQLGYLWQIRPMENRPMQHRTLTGHDGLTFGFTSVLQIDREDGTAVIALVNRAERIDGITPQLFAFLDTL